MHALLLVLLVVGSLYWYSFNNSVFVSRQVQPALDMHALQFVLLVLSIVRSISCPSSDLPLLVALLTCWCSFIVVLVAVAGSCTPTFRHACSPLFIGMAL